MPTTHVFQFGDQVVHPGKPEWGTGQVTKAQGIVHEGAQCQRLTIRFDRAGLKTISTAFADLVPADLAEAPADIVGATSEDPNWLEELEQGDLNARMAKLPEPATDPFSSPQKRLKATLALYRFGRTGGSLIDWAAAQTRLKDPLSRFNRHEIELFFDRFAQARDEHLRNMVRELQRNDPQAIQVAAEGAPAEGVNALRRYLGNR